MNLHDASRGDETGVRYIHCWNRQHDRDLGQSGLLGSSVQVKRRCSATHDDLATWCAPAVAQAGADRQVLLYFVNLGRWHAVWPLASLLAASSLDAWAASYWKVISSMEAGVEVARHRLGTTLLPGIKSGGLVTGNC